MTNTSHETNTTHETPALTWYRPLHYSRDVQEALPEWMQDYEAALHVGTASGPDYREYVVLIYEEEDEEGGEYTYPVVLSCPWVDEGPRTLEEVCPTVADRVHDETLALLAWDMGAS